MSSYLDDMVTGYIECALWAGFDYPENQEDDPQPLDANYSTEDVSEEALAEIRQDCEAFLADQRDNLGLGPRWGDGGCVGQDFYLTRNGHGAGFWDRYFSGPAAAAGGRLTDAAHVYGTSELYPGSDGKLYLSR